MDNWKGWADCWLGWVVVPVVAVTPPEPLRISGGKRIAAYTIDNNGVLRKKIDALIKFERKQEEDDQKMIDAILAYWIKS